MPQTQALRQNDIPYYSISRLDAFNKCGKYYQLKYIERIPSDGLNKSNLLGSILHKALECLYENKKWLEESPLDYFSEAVRETLIKAKLIGEFELDLIKSLEEYSKLTDSLYLRANKDYEGADAIRTKDGKIPSNPQMTGQWKKLEGELGISIRKEAIDNFFRERPPHINFSITDVLSEARNLCSKYQHHPEITNVIGIEVPISQVNDDEITNPVSLEPLGVEGYYLHGFVDLLGEYRGRGIIIDHKTSMKVPSIEDISHHIQLLTYSWAMEQINPSMPMSYVGIDHIRTGQVIIAQVPANRDELLREYFKAHQDISNGLFRMKLNMCSDWFGGKCPYYSHCHNPT
jgi:hypothetical protein